MHDFAFQI